MAITVDRKSVSELIQKSEHGIRSIFLLKMAGTDQQRHAMIKDIQIDPVSRKMTHIDFVRIVMDEVVRVNVPIHLNGTSKGVKEGGLLDFQVRELHIECLPNAKKVVLPGVSHDAPTAAPDVFNAALLDYLRNN